MIEVLQYIPSFNYGGIESLMTNVNKYIDKSIHFTYLVEVDVEEETLNNIRKMGADIIRIPNMTKEGLWKHIIQVNKLFKEKKYDVVHVHGCDLRIFVMMFAKFHGVKKRIYHIHSARIERHSKIKKIFLKINFFLSNCIIACSEKAAKKMCPNNKKVVIIRNGIETEKYKFSESDRKRVRKEYNIKDDTLLIGNIGRLTEVKNQEYLIEIVSNMINNKRNVKLMFVGEGELKEQLALKCRKLKIEKNVFFIGKVQNASSYYSAMDVFCLPSFSEGFPLVTIEAETNGLPCIVSENVPKEINVTNNVTFLSIGDNNIKKWENEIETQRRSEDSYELINKGEYDILNMVKKIENIYMGEKYEIAE